MGRHTNVAKLLPPEYITLPDGRRFLVKDLVIKPQNKTAYNLRLGIKYTNKRQTKMVSNKVDK